MGWSSPRIADVTIDEEKDSIAISFELDGYKRVLAPFYMEKDYSKKKLAQLFKTMDIELDENTNYNIVDLKKILDDYIDQEVDYVLFKHRRISGKNGFNHVVSAYYYSGKEQTKYDERKIFVDETTSK
jgi:hypothetical protein